MGIVSDNARNVKTCPYCKELINAGAIRCPQCLADLIVPRPRKKVPFWRCPFMLGFYFATILWLVGLIIFSSKS